MEDDLIMCPEIARMAGLSKAKMDELRKDPSVKFPKPVSKKGGYKSRSYYKKSSVIDWINANDMNAFRERRKPWSKISHAKSAEQSTLDNGLAQRFIRGEFRAKFNFES